MTRITKYRNFAVAGLVSLLAGPADWAMAAANKKAFDAPTPWLAYAVVAVALAGVCVVAFRKPTRSQGQ